MAFSSAFSGRQEAQERRTCKRKHGDWNTSNTNTAQELEETNRRRRTQSDGNYSYFDDIRTSDNVTVYQRQGSAVQRINDSFRMAHVLSMFYSNYTASNSLELSIEIGGFLAVQHFNQRSGQVLPNLPDRLKGCDLYLTMDLLDTGGSPTTAVLELLDRRHYAPTLENPNPMGIVGAGASVTSESLSTIGAVHNVGMTSCCATSQKLDEVSQHPFFTRTIPTNLGNARAAAKYYQYLGVTHVASLNVNDAFGIAFASMFASEANALNISVFPSVSYTRADASSIQAALRELKGSKRKYIFGMFYTSHLMTIADYASQEGIMGENDYVWIIGEGDDQLRYETTAENRERILKATYGLGWIEMDVPENERYNAALEAFKSDEALQEYYLSRKVLPEDWPPSEGAQRSLLSSVYAPEFALLNYDAAIAMGIAACETNNTLFSAPEWFETMLGTEFVGVTADTVHFDNKTGTRRLVQVGYKIENLLPYADPNDDMTIHLQPIKSAVVDKNATVVEVIAPFVYPDNTTNPPPFLPPHNVNSHLIPEWALAIGLSFTGVVMLMSIFWCVWSVLKRKNRIVRASQPFFLIMLCVGTFLMATSIIPTSFQEPMEQRTLDVGCMLFPWLISIGFVTAFSALFTKNGRINSIFENARAFRRVTIRPKDVLAPFLILLSLNLTLLSLWTALDPWKWDRVFVGEDVYERPTDSYGTCVGENPLSRLCGVLLLAVNLVPVVLANYQCYRARNLPSEFNESRYVAMSMASMMEACLLGLPIGLVAVDPTANFLSRALVVCAACAAILMPMFLPKMIYLHKPRAVRHVRTSEYGSEISN